MSGKRYVLLGVAAYFVFLLATLPASVAWKYFVDFADMPQLNQQVSQLDGSVWDGSTKIHIDSLSYPLTWHVSLRSVWRLGLELDLSSHQDIFSADAKVFISPFGLALRETRVKVSEDLVNRSLQSAAASMTNPVFINVQEVDWAWGSFSEASGRIAWEGGLVTYRDRRNTKQLPVPSMLGSLSSEDGSLVLTFANSAEAGAEELISARLSGEGLGLVQIRRRLFDLLGQRWAPNSQAEDIIFEVSQQLWN